MQIEEKLRNEKLKHKEEESALLQKVGYMETQISEVQNMYQTRMYEIETPFNATKTIPSSGARDDISKSSLIIDEKYKHLSYGSSMQHPLPSYSSASVLLQNELKSEVNVKRHNYADSWLTAGYVGTISDSEKTLSSNASTLKIQ